MLKMNVFLWTVLLLSASQWEYMCAHRSYDWRSRDCVRFKGSSECVEVAQFCLTPSAINTFSPRWLSNLAGYGGPLLTWLPLLAQEHFHHKGDTVRSALICTTLLWYLAFISGVRHFHLLLTSKWDPSGHCFVYGSQLLPLWALTSLPNQAAPWMVTLWSYVLLYLSAATAAAFHLPTETLAAWLLVLLLHFALLSRIDAMDGRSHDAVAASKQLRRRSYLVFPAWLVCTAAAWESARRNRGLTTELGLEAAYDLGLWALLLLLLQRAERDAQAG